MFLASELSGLLLIVQIFRCASRLTGFNADLAGRKDRIVNYPTHSTAARFKVAGRERVAATKGDGRRKR